MQREAWSERVWQAVARTVRSRRAYSTLFVGGPTRRSQIDSGDRESGWGLTIYLTIDNACSHSLRFDSSLHSSRHALLRAFINPLLASLAIRSQLHSAISLLLIAIKALINVDGKIAFHAIKNFPRDICRFCRNLFPATSSAGLYTRTHYLFAMFFFCCYYLVCACCGLISSATAIPASPPLSVHTFTAHVNGPRQTCDNNNTARRWLIHKERRSERPLSDDAFTQTLITHAAATESAET